MRYRLRTLLLLLAIVPPMIAYQYRRWVDLGLWQRLTDARQERDAALVEWRWVFDGVTSGKIPESQEVDAQRRYYAGREQVELAHTRLVERYGDEKRMLDAMRALQQQK